VTTARYGVIESALRERHKTKTYTTTGTRSREPQASARNRLLASQVTELLPWNWKALDNPRPPSQRKARSCGYLP
jgi:hypothetical protein